MKTAERDRQRNKRIKSNLRSALKDFRATKGGEKSELRQLASLLDSAAKKRVIHKNKAARMKSRLSKLLKTK
jgi:small subunit ribosomal protein S20